MLHFGKKIRFGKIATNEEDDNKDEQVEAYFAPQIITDDNSAELPSMVFDDLDTEEKEEESKELETDPLPPSARVEKLFYDIPLEEEKPEEVLTKEEAPAEGEEAAEAPEEPEEDETATLSCPAEIFAGIHALPQNEQVYGLYGAQMLLSCPDEAGGIYLFEENGDYILAQTEDCAAYLRVRSVRASFRGKVYETTDLSYLLKEKSFPIALTARSKEEYDLALKDGYLPYAAGSSGKTVRMIKPISLYRMKDLALRVEFSDGRSGGEYEELLVNFERSIFEETDGAKQFKRICKATAEKILSVPQPFYTMQALKVRKNLVLAFPMDGRPALGDNFAGSYITDLAYTDDGTAVLRVGNDENISLKISDGQTVRGQHIIALS